MSSTEGGSSDKPRFRMRTDPGAGEPDMPTLEQLPDEEEVEYVIEDLEAADSPAGGAATAARCYCFGRTVA